ncbi:hypothetical protein TNCV_4593181 [Trichonephila clavipes]|nr:hypothetical protein TNCV_4593181 [Trichonephila clavipes]
MENEKTTPTRQLERNNSTGENNSLSSRNEQLNSALPSTACNRLQLPTTARNRLQPPRKAACNRLQTACTAFTAESAFSTY